MKQGIKPSLDTCMKTNVVLIKISSTSVKFLIQSLLEEIVVLVAENIFEYGDASIMIAPLF